MRISANDHPDEPEARAVFANKILGFTWVKQHGEFRALDSV